MVIIASQRNTGVIELRADEMSGDYISCFVLFESRIQEIYNMYEGISFVFYCNVKNLLVVQLLILEYHTYFERRLRRG